MGPTRRGVGGRKDAWKRRRTQNGEEDKNEEQNKGRRKTQDMQGTNTEPHRRSRKRKVIDRESGPEKETIAEPRRIPPETEFFEPQATKEQRKAITEKYGEEGDDVRSEYAEHRFEAG